jgi:hypothetical protein
MGKYTESAVRQTSLKSPVLIYEYIAKFSKNTREYVNSLTPPELASSNFDNALSGFDVATTSRDSVTIFFT